jgi:signal transduction histidine kinase
MFRTLYSKLSLTLFVLVIVIGLLLFQLIRYSSEMYQQEVTQKLNSTLAEHIVAEELLFKNNKINETALKNIFHMMMVINPSIELYLLDKEGAVLYYSAPDGKIKRRQVDIAPIKRFISGDRKYPMAGEDPRDSTRLKVFSAARIPRQGALQGYLYVVLGSEKFVGVAEMLRESYILRLSIWGLAAGMVIALVSGLIAFGMLTKRLQRLSGIIHRFADRGATNTSAARYPVKYKPGDEIDALGEHFNAMADKIDAQWQELEKMDRLRRELIANVSHDLRTPIANLHGYIETLLLKNKTLSDEDRKQYLEIAVANSQRLAKLVDELFELSKLDSCETVVYAEPFSIGELIQDVVQKFQLKADQMNIQLKTEFNVEAPLVYGDIGMMQRVLENLTENALRHTTENGTITIGLVPNGGEVIIRVADTGCGIPKDQLEHIFERFSRLDKSRPKSESSGLGLAITKRIIELHGSTIAVNSQVNHGTTFSFGIPKYQG